MKKVALLFPGQGCQFPKMAHAIKDDPDLWKMFQKIDDIVHNELLRYTLEGPAEKLTLTYNAQPAIFAVSSCLFLKVKDWLDHNNIEIDSLAGHSAGEYSALFAAQSLSFEDGLSSLYARGLFMQESVPRGQGKMLAIIKADIDDIKQSLKTSPQKEGDRIVIANYNTPSQVVLSGDAIACDRAKQWLLTQAKKRPRVIELNVSAPFHSPLMTPARKKMESFLKDLAISPNSIDYIANWNASFFLKKTSAETIKKNLIHQIDQSVLWEDSIRKMGDRVDCFIEIGPKPLLCNMIKQILPHHKNLSICSLEDIKNLV